MRKNYLATAGQPAPTHQRANPNIGVRDVAGAMARDFADGPNAPRDPGGMTVTPGQMRDRRVNDDRQLLASKVRQLREQMNQRGDLSEHEMLLGLMETASPDTPLSTLFAEFERMRSSGEGASRMTRRGQVAY